MKVNGAVQKPHVTLEYLTLALFVCLTLTLHGACVKRRSCIGLGVISAGACKAVKTVNLSVNLSQSSVSQLLTVILSSSHLVQVCAIESDCFAKSQREMSSCQVVESGSGNVW